MRQFEALQQVMHAVSFRSTAWPLDRPAPSLSADYWSMSEQLACEIEVGDVPLAVVASSGDSVPSDLAVAAPPVVACDRCSTSAGSLPIQVEVLGCSYEGIR